MLSRVTSATEYFTTTFTKTSNMNLPKGFRYSGVAAGIKASGKKDVALIVCDEGATAAGVYTQNIVRASSIDWNVAITPSDQFRAIVVNSGNANACTGDQGVANNQQMAATTGAALGVPPEQVAVLSTGVIGVQLPMKKIEKGIQDAASVLADGESSFTAASEAITTTDKSPKTVGATVTIGGESVTVAAMAKGAGMIGPRMATMLGVVTTDAKVTSEIAQKILGAATAASFNRISVEGHMSTNDAVLLLASGKSGAQISTDADIEKLSSVVTDVCIELAKMIPADGEGATHLIQIDIQGTETDEAADQIARTVAASALVKTAVTGNDPNWGRIVSAVGYAGVDLDADQINLSLNGFELFAAGQPVAFAAAEVSKSIGDNFETKIELSVGAGSGKARHWTSDLTVDYVRFNSEYTT